MVEADQHMSEVYEPGSPFWPDSPSSDAVEKSEKYFNLVEASEGFYSDVREHSEFAQEFSPTCAAMQPMNTDSVIAMEIGRHALNTFNESMGKNLDFIRIVRANQQLVNGKMFYLTFEASDGCFYEAKVFVPPSFEPEDFEVDFVRLAAHYPEVQFPSWWGQESVPIDYSLPEPTPLPYGEDEEEDSNRPLTPTGHSTNIVI